MKLITPVLLVILLFTGSSTVVYAGDGIMVFKVTPKDAKVFVDDEFKGEANGLVLSLDEGNHHVEIKKGKQSNKKSYFVPSDGVVKVTLALDTVPTVGAGKTGFKSISSSYGYLKVLSKPAGMEIYLNEKYAGTTPAKRIKVDSGNYHLTIKDPNAIYTPYQKDFAIEKFGLETVQATLPKGFATVFFIGEGAASVCGNPAMVPGPVIIPAGETVVQIKGANGGYQQRFQLKAGQEVEAEYILQASQKNKLSACKDIGMEFVTIQPGCFQIKSNNPFIADDKNPRHRVCLTQPYQIGQYEVTQGQVKQIMGIHLSHNSNCGDNCPVEKVSWDNIQFFINKLKLQTGVSYRLPTEVEWEYACRGGQNYRYCGSNNVDDVAWFRNNSGKKAHPVGQKLANGYGLYDMSGNVNEWVQDFYVHGYYHDYNGAVNDPQGPNSGREHVIRGGGWDSNDYATRTGSRYGGLPSSRYLSIGFSSSDVLGFRLVRMP